MLRLIVTQVTIHFPFFNETQQTECCTINNFKSYADIIGYFICVNLTLDPSIARAHFLFLPPELCSASLSHSTSCKLGVLEDMELPPFYNTNYPECNAIAVCIFLTSFHDDVAQAWEMHRPMMLCHVLFVINIARQNWRKG